MGYLGRALTHEGQVPTDEDSLTPKHGRANIYPWCDYATWPVLRGETLQCTHSVGPGDLQPLREVVEGVGLGAYGVLGPRYFGEEPRAAVDA